MPRDRTITFNDLIGKPDGVRVKPEMRTRGTLQPSVAGGA